MQRKSVFKTLNEEAEKNDDKPVRPFASRNFCEGRSCAAQKSFRTLTSMAYPPF